MEAVWAMTRNSHFLLTALLLTASMGCTDRDAQTQHIDAAQEALLAGQAQAGDAEAAKKLEQIQKARSAMPQGETEYAPDIRDGWQWSADEVAALIKRANSGDMKAADRLHQYYSVHEDEAQIAYWEDWLFKRGDPGAIEMRAHRLYSASGKRPTSDPRKLVELKEAERLERSVTADLADNPFLDKMRSEIAVIERSR
jgi:hypothetical protein